MAILSLKPCRRALACKGCEPKMCLWRSLEKVPRPEQLQARQKLLNTTPRHFGEVEREVRKMMPHDFFLEPISPARIEEMLAPVRRKREFDKQFWEDMHPFGPDGLGPKRKPRR
jgi:hypothetical protein